MHITKKIALSIFFWITVFPLSVTKVTAQELNIRIIDYKEEYQNLRSLLWEEWENVSLLYNDFVNNLPAKTKKEVLDQIGTMNAEIQSIIKEFYWKIDKTAADLITLHDDIKHTRTIYISQVVNLLKDDNSSILYLQSWYKKWMTHLDARFELRVDFETTEQIFQIAKYSRSTQIVVYKIMTKLLSVESKIDSAKLLPIYQSISDQLQLQISILISQWKESYTESLIAISDLFNFKIVEIKKKSANPIENIAQWILYDLLLIDLQ